MNLRLLLGLALLASPAAAVSRRAPAPRSLKLPPSLVLPALPGQAILPRAKVADAFIDDYLSRVRDVSLRDGHQSLDGNRWTIQERAPIAKLIDKLKLHSVESGGGADYDVATIIGESPWDNQRTFNEAFAETDQQWLFRGRNALGLGPQAPEVVAATVKHAAKNGLKRIRVFDGMNDPENVKTTIEAGREADIVVEAALAYTVDPAGTPKDERVWTVDAFADLAREFRRMGANAIAVKDMAGVLTSRAIAELIPRLHKGIGLPISVHSHSSTGRGPGVLETALRVAEKIGATVVIDTAIGDLSGGTSHPDLRYMLTRALRRAGFKKADYAGNEKLRLLAEIEAKIAETAAKHKGGRIQVDEEMRLLIDASGVPGGMIGTTAKLVRPNLDVFRQKLGLPELTVTDVIKEGLKRVPQVRRDAGSPPLVTPMSQFVLMQAIYNYMNGEDYKMVLPQFAAMVRGRFGRVRGKVSSELLAKLPAEAAAALPRSFPELVEEARRLADEHALGVKDPVEAALLLTAKNGEAVLRGDDPSKFEPRADKTPAPALKRAWGKKVGVRKDGFPIVESLEGARTRAEIEAQVADLAKAIAILKKNNLDASAVYAEAERRLDALGLAGRARIAGKLILDELIAKQNSWR